MKILRPPDYRVMAWKNGGGSTTELYVFPTDVGRSGKPFQWRASIADVAKDGPFSRFEGYDRHIMLIHGNGMTIEGAPQGPIEVSAKYEPQSFSGEWNVNGRLVQGPVRDFNLMSRRAECVSRLRMETIDGARSIESGAATLLIYLLEGKVDCDRGELQPADCLLMLPGEATTLMGTARPVRVAVCEVYGA